MWKWPKEQRIKEKWLENRWWTSNSIIEYVMLELNGETFIQISKNRRMDAESKILMEIDIEKID